MLDIPFVKNPGGQCGQACMAMALKYYFPETEFSIGQMSDLMKRKDGKWTFPYQNAVVLDELGLKVKSFSSVDVPVERDKMVGSFQEAFGKDYYEVMKNIDLDNCEYFIKKAKEKSIFEVRRHTMDDIQKYVGQNFIVMVCVDSNVLNGKSGSFVGHFVIIVGMDSENVWINDPGRDANNRHNRKLFEKAYTVPAIDDDILVVFGKK